MDACLRFNFTIKQTGTSIVLPQFVGRTNGLPYDFSGFTGLLNHVQFGQPPSALTLTSLASVNGVVLLNHPGTGYVTVRWTGAGAGLLAAIARSFTHFLSIVDLYGNEYPLVVGADVITPGW